MADNRIDQLAINSHGGSDLQHCQRSDGGVSVVAMVKQSQQYVVVFESQSTHQALRKIWRWAARKDMEFNARDALLMSTKIRGK